MPARRGTTKKRARKAAPSKRNNGANLGFELKLWQAADKLRGHMDVAEYKHVVLGLVFLKYISDAFEAERAKLEAQHGKGTDAEDSDEYRFSDTRFAPWQKLSLRSIR